MALIIVCEFEATQGLVLFYPEWGWGTSIWSSPTSRTGTGLACLYTLISQREHNLRIQLVVQDSIDALSLAFGPDVLLHQANT